MKEPKRISRIVITIIAFVVVITICAGIFFYYQVYSGKNIALDAAFNDAKVLPESAKAVEVDIDFRLGGSLYEVEFYSERQKYEYLIDSKGVILIGGKKTDEKSSAHASVNSAAEENINVETVTDISEKHARQLAISHANAVEDKIYDYDADIEIFDSIKIYEIEFKYNGYEYEYYINASNGALVQYSKEKE